MHGGPLMFLRQSAEQMRYAKPWQQALFSGGLTVAGVALLIVLQHPLGILLILFGAVFMRRTVQNVIRSRRSRGAYRSEETGASSKSLR